jgi:outer membrane PBP1 activator LpoA protein
MGYLFHYLGNKCRNSYKEKYMAKTIHLLKAKGSNYFSLRFSTIPAKKSIGTTFLALLILSGCASTPQPPTSDLLAAEQAIASAERARVSDYASVELSDARDKLSAARSAVREEKMVQAQHLAQQAKADAELASAKSEVAKARIVNEQMQKGTDTLKQEMQRKTGDQ